MNPKIPFSFLPFDLLKRISKPFDLIGRKIVPLFPYLKQYFQTAEIKVEPVTYINSCLAATSLFYFFTSLILAVFLFLFDIENFIGMSFIVGVPIALFAFIQQILYPKILSNRRIRDIDKNLLPALEHVLINLNSGVPLFNTLVSISLEDFGEISKEFKKAVKRINAGEPQIEVLNKIADENPSLFFRRAIWQLVNGMKAGSDISAVISEIINALSEEQLIQIDNYGQKLKSLAMFYMMMAVILPSLGMTFLIVISSFIGTSETSTKIIFWVLYGLVIFMQFMFLGVVRSIRPALLGDEHV